MIASIAAVERGAPDAPIWTPTPERIARSNLVVLARLLRDRYGVALGDYPALYDFSVREPQRFWSALWDVCGIIGERGSDVVVDDVERMPGARWFPDARLNFAENMLRRRDGSDALVALSESGAVRRVSFRALYDEVSRAMQALARAGVRPGDRVSGFMPNVPEAVIAMLATTGLGAIWSVCSTDFGVEAVVDRLGQIEPKVLVTAQSYSYSGRQHDLAAKAADVVARLPSVERVVVVGSDVGGIGNGVTWDAFLRDLVPAPIAFERFAFDHPALILFSSGTSGAPKCIVHGTGGPLLQNKKDLMLQFDVKRDDRIFWWTSTGWVAWNMLLFGLACEATVLLYDGSPFHPRAEILFDYAQQERVTFLRLTPKYIETIAKAGVRPIASHDLSALATITVGGAPFSAEGYDYVYANIKRDVHLASPAGGTDPLGAFAVGSPISPVWRGEMQCRGLGLAIEVWDENARPVVGERGELVVTRAFPSMPLRFWGEGGDERYFATYFATYPDVWRHGDWAEITPRGGVMIFGRSDATLKVRGVRIGTAEIYRQVERVAEVADCVVVAHSVPDADEEILLFVQLASGVSLGPALVGKINAEIARGTSPRYVPDRVIAVADIPRTATGKVSESAVQAAVHGRRVVNANALANPQALALFAPEAIAR
jgi:acetoacetyl-CoA synthetase